VRTAWPQRGLTLSGSKEGGVFGLRQSLTLTRESMAARSYAREFVRWRVWRRPEYPSPGRARLRTF